MWHYGILSGLAVLLERSQTYYPCLCTFCTAIHMEGVWSAVHICLVDVYSRAWHISDAAPDLERDYHFIYVLKNSKKKTKQNKKTRHLAFTSIPEWCFLHVADTEIYVF